ncbi:DNA helicase [Trifolium repens]|nr:DNA helicase [Trifolium repens]
MNQESAAARHRQKLAAFKHARFKRKQHLNSRRNKNIAAAHIASTSQLNQPLAEERHHRKKRSTPKKFTPSLIQNTIIHCQNYMDIGPPKFMCQDCGSTMWYDERANKPKKTKESKVFFVLHARRCSIRLSETTTDVFERTFELYRK